MKLFDKEKALVTGAGNGIGKAIALLNEGVDVVAADVSAQRLETLTEACADAPGHLVTRSGDLARQSDTSALLDFAMEKLGQIHLFVHSASPPRSEKDHMFAVDEQTWRDMHAVNLEAAFFLGRELARQMIRNELTGSMLMLTSLHAGTPRNLPHYSTSKGAMQMLVREMAKSLGPHGIRVNAMVPGAIAAGGFQADPAMARYIPLGRLGRSEDLASMALAVLSNTTGGYVTGTDIVVDGGISLTNWFDAPLFDPADL